MAIDFLNLSEKLQSKCGRKLRIRDLEMKSFMETVPSWLRSRYHKQHVPLKNGQMETTKSVSW